MATFSFAYELVDEDGDFPVAISRMEQQAEQRRLISSKKVRRFKIRSPKLTKTQMQAWQTFYDARSGQLDQFDFASPFEGDFDVILNVRFASPLKMRFTGMTHTVTADLLVVNQDES